MIKELKHLAEDGNPWDHYHWNTRRAALLKGQLDSLSGQHRTQTWFKYCHELLNCGETLRCIEEVENYLKLRGLPKENLLDTGTKPLFELLAIAYLRLGEQENCQRNHSRYSCIVPIQGAGVHRFSRGSEKAIELYSLLNSRFPEDGYKWFVNLAYMTLGQYPDSVPKELFLSIPLQEDPARFPRFREIAEDLGVNVSGLSGGVCIEDFNNDGRLDLFVTSYGMEDNVRLFLSNANGGMSDATVSSGLEGITSGLNCIHADYDNDGLTDILVLRGAWLGRGGKHPNSLLKNLGNGKFTDVTRSVGLLSYHPTQTAAWGDFDKDGDLDLFIGNESGAETVHFCELYRNNGNGTFTEVSAEKGLAGMQAFVKGVVWGDTDNDGFPELFISVLGGKNRLFKYLNGTFTDVADKAGVAEPWYGFSCWFWDVNNDGFQDLFVGSYDLDHLHDVAGVLARELQGKNPLAETSKLFINNGDGTFHEAAETYGVDKAFFSMGANFGDLDNDGWLDFYIGTGAPDFSSIVPNRMFRNVEGKAFEEVTYQGHFGHVQKGHGIAFADMDADGDQDIYAVMGGAYEGDDFTNVLFDNPGNNNHSITLKLDGNRSGSSAIGTRVQCILPDGTEVNRWVGTGGSFGSSPLQVSVGIGKHASVNELNVFWTNSAPQVFNHLAANTVWKITEGNSDIEPVDLETQSANFSRAK